MEKQTGKGAASKYPLRMLVSIRRGAEEFAAKEGVSLNQFINVAIAEKLAHLQHVAWLERRAKVTDASIARAMSLLARSGNQPPEPADELPKGYIPASSPSYGQEPAGRSVRPKKRSRAVIPTKIGEHAVRSRR